MQAWLTTIAAAIGCALTSQLSPTTGLSPPKNVRASIISVFLVWFVFLFSTADLVREQGNARPRLVLASKPSMSVIYYTQCMSAPLFSSYTSGCLPIIGSFKTMHD